MPAGLRRVLQAVGLIAWLWVVAQGIVAGSADADADAGSLLLWTYGWIGLPILSAFAGPIWQWIDPFSTLFDLGAAALRRLNVASWSTAAYPTRWVAGRRSAASSSSCGWNSCS